MCAGRIGRLHSGRSHDDVHSKNNGDNSNQKVAIQVVCCERCHAAVLNSEDIEDCKRKLFHGTIRQIACVSVLSKAVRWVNGTLNAWICFSVARASLRQFSVALQGTEARMVIEAWQGPRPPKAAESPTKHSSSAAATGNSGKPAVQLGQANGTAVT